MERCIQYQFRSEKRPEQVACLSRLKRHFLNISVRSSLSGYARANGIKGTMSQVKFAVESIIQNKSAFHIYNYSEKPK